MCSNTKAQINDVANGRFVPVCKLIKVFVALLTGRPVHDVGILS